MERREYYRTIYYEINMKKILGIILSVLGFAGCDVIGSHADEYGTPYAEFEVKGSVTDGANPIKMCKYRMEIHSMKIIHLLQTRPIHKEIIIL